MTPPHPVQIETLVCGPLANNVYLVVDPSTRHAIVVDPGLEAEVPVRRALEARGLTLDAIVATHGHWDHVAGVANLSGQTGALVLAHTADADRLRRPPRPMLMPELTVLPSEVDRELSAGDTVACGRVDFTVLHTPGHTEGSICLYHAASNTLLSGDTLFAGSFGRYDLPGGNPDVLRASLLQLATLPPKTTVYPGHGPRTEIGRERWLSRPPL